MKYNAQVDRRGSGRHDRRAAPRVPYKAKASVFFNNNNYTCNIINLSRDGALLSSPVDAEPGNYLRLNLRLPGMDDLIDLDATMVRQASPQKDRWAVSFFEVSKRAAQQLDDYISDVLKRHVEKKALLDQKQEQEENKRELAARVSSDQRRPTPPPRAVSGSISGSGEWRDWKTLQSAVAQRMKKVTQKIAPSQVAAARAAKPKPARTYHDEFEESLGSLDDIYRDALQTLGPKKKNR